MGYYRDISKISIDQYKQVLKATDLIPSWEILREDIDDNLEAIKSQGIDDLEELSNVLKNKGKLIKLSEATGLSEQYLNVLRRVINGYRPQPNKIKDFPNIDESVAKKLEALKIKNTLQLYPYVLTSEKRKELCEKAGIGPDEVMLLTRLTDISRIKWVNHTFAYVLFEAGYHSAQDIAEADHVVLHDEIKTLNAERQFYKAHIGLRDMKFCVDAAAGLDFEIEY